MKHPHAEVIKAWADGKTIQVLCGNAEDSRWIDLTYSEGNWCTFSQDNQYRIKPEEAVRYTIISQKGNAGVAWFETPSTALDYYTSPSPIQGFLKRTTIDGKVVKMEFVPK